MLVRSPVESVSGVEHVIDVSCFLVPNTYLPFIIHFNHSGKRHVSPKKEKNRKFVNILKDGKHSLPVKIIVMFRVYKIAIVMLGQPQFKRPLCLILRNRHVYLSK